MLKYVISSAFTVFAIMGIRFYPSHITFVSAGVLLVLIPVYLVFAENLSARNSCK